MKIVTLIENTTKDDNLIFEHGLSLYIEHAKWKILLDTGQGDGFLKNAEKLGVDIGKVDFAVISHFHYDHAGGLRAFFEANKKAKVYIGREAFADYYIMHEGMKYFGLRKEGFDMDRFIFVDDYLDIAEDVKIISKLGYNFDNPMNDKAFKKVNDEFIKDDFSHEIAIVIDDREKSTLLSGCFHSGVVNAVKRAKEVGCDIKRIVGGFHLQGRKDKADANYVAELINLLSEGKIESYTGHCTGNIYNELQRKLPDAVFELYTGAKYSL
jgi:7,8-dihydropterin-6-yl-methyl-4-(beta-D-ribofuranosyl)aminobenzene 5'-phosphate synthase